MEMKVTRSHLERSACVYLRQSTMEQVRDHHVSTERQYALVDRAVDLGWPRGQVQVLDGDLGKSGTTAEGRDDFHHLCASVGLGEVGAVFAIEASRLSRNQADWHRLLDLCAWTHTLLIEHDGIYDPNDFNDRVILGFKGTWSHTELHAMRLRMDGARRYKAAKGEYRFRPPTGYVWAEGGRLSKDPDEGVVMAVQRVFELFRSLGSGYAVARYHAERSLKFPFRHWTGGAGLGPLRWGPLRVSHVIGILKNPIYAGAYVHGRRPLRPVVQDGNLVGRRQVTLPEKEWAVCIPDFHPGYISWAQYQENRSQMTMNRTWVETGSRLGRPREGQALLQGLVWCGRCGRRMQVRYFGSDGRRPQYFCPRRDVGTSKEGESTCWTTVACLVDKAVEQHVLKQMTKDNLDLSLAVLNQIEGDAAAEARQWELRLERARLEVARAERQYNLVEPENRLVVRTLERRWEEKLAELTELEHSYREQASHPRLDLNEQDRHRILRLTQDLPAIWKARTTEQHERKELLGLLVQQVVLVPQDVPQPEIQVRLLWHTGATTEFSMKRLQKWESSRTSKEALDLIRDLMTDHTDAGIAATLNISGIKTGRGSNFTDRSVCVARHANGLMRRERDARAAGKLIPREDGRYSTPGLAALVGVREYTIHCWRRAGMIQGRQESERGPWWYSITPELLESLRERARRNAERSRLTGGNTSTVQEDV